MGDLSFTVFRRAMLTAFVVCCALTAVAGQKLAVTINNQSCAFWRTADLESAKKEAAAAHKPIAWIASASQFLDGQGIISGMSSRSATLHEFFALHHRTILVFEDAYAENHQVLQLVDAALHTPNPHYTPPTVVFLNPDATEVLAKVQYETDFVKRAHDLADALETVKGKL